jgi:ubiquinone/menaquinone biosynthesis C-methylase UbiE
VETASCDLITVATAIHWLDTDKFYPEARRILKPGGIIAVWTYGEDSITPEIDKVVADYSFNFVGRYWPAENKKAWNFEELVEFPFNRIPSPEFKLIVQWSLKDYMNYIYTWSATQNYIKQNGENPIELFYGEFKKVWGDEDQKREVTKPLQIKIGRV